MMLDFSQKFSRIKSHKAQLGQVLAEILIAIVIAGIVIGGIAGTIGTSVITSKKTRQITAATGLAQQDIEAAKAVAESSWLSIYCPPSGTCPGNKGPSNHYKAVLSGGSWQIQSGEATSTIDALTYTHYFYIENVNRDEGGDIKTDGTEDPSTQKITVMVTWSGETNFTMAEYLMRTTSSYFRDFNWSSGNLGEGPYTSSQGKYSTTSGDVMIDNSAIKLNI